jgi:hypothetical protein
MAGMPGLKMKIIYTIALVFSVLLHIASGILLEVNSPVVLALPALSPGRPSAGKRVAVTSPEYGGTEVFHTIYLPVEWKADGPQLPIIFEYTGNYAPRSGSTGKIEDSGLGYGLSGGKFIWVSLPYINQDHTGNQITWWGDEIATVDYAKKNFPPIIREFNGDPRAIFLCGFSRGAIGVNYLGLYDDEIAGLWTAFITHDHFDGVKEWKNASWGTPLETYQAGAIARLKLVAGRPYLVCQNGDNYGTKAFLQSVLPSINNFTFRNINTTDIFGSFPHPLAKAAHTDRWPLLPSQYRTQTWKWMNEMVERFK